MTQQYGIHVKETQQCRPEQVFTKFRQEDLHYDDSETTKARRHEEIEPQRSPRTQREKQSEFAKQYQPESPASESGHRLWEFLVGDSG